jgi:SAM-dependent methyltransferase
VSSRADRGWEQFAGREPYFATVTDPRFLQANLTPEHEREFFASGETLVEWMLATIDAALVPQFAPMSTLEYGCGPGRLALPLAARPGRVVAVDRSDAMLRVARANAGRRGLAEILFQRPDDLLAQPRTFDLVVCYHLLQRLPRGEAKFVLRQLQSAIGPDGVGVFQWCCGSREPLRVEVARWARERVPGVNAIVNRLKGKPSGDPFMPTHVYGVEEMLAEFAAAGLDPVHVALERHGTIDYAIAFAHRRTRTLSETRFRPNADTTSARKRAAERTPAIESPPDEIGDAELAEWNRAAEAYFASLTSWDHHLAKPFSQMEETPTLLASVAVLLQALRLSPGMTVLEFGAGTGWLSRFLTQMGCRAILLDLSATALRIAREHYARQPVIGDRPAPAFLEFDGRRIDLPDGSVDRVICFDSFHHAPNARAVIAEFGRVLRPAGIAGFVEPGPRHAEAPRSRFEAGTYGVVERDVDVHDIRRAARAHGFADLRMCVFHAPLYQVTLEEYEDLLAGGGVGARWLDSSRAFLRHVRTFTLIKQGQEPADSRAMAGLACEIRAHVVDGAIDAFVTNTGTATWLPWGTPVGGVGLGMHLSDASGALVAFDFHVDPLADPPRAVAPGETLHRRVLLPPLPPGSYRVELDCVAAHVAWFAQAGSKTVVLALDL